MVVVKYRYFGPTNSHFTTSTTYVVLSFLYSTTVDALFYGKDDVIVRITDIFNDTNWVPTSASIITTQEVLQAI